MYFEVQEIGVAYDKTILRNVSITIAPGERVALIGSSGAGKSTIAKLLKCARDPDCGQILLDSVPLTEYDRSSVLRYVGSIEQKPELFSGTVRQNVLLATHPEDLPKITDETIWHVLDTLSLDFRKLFGEAGLDRKVGKQGLTLSGGQAQRLCIARALIKEPRFLIVDEATSSLDAVTQEAVQIGMEKLLQPEASALIIAHRLSTLRRCTKFVVIRPLDQCRCDESQIEAVASSMQELHACSETFRTLAKMEGISF